MSTKKTKVTRTEIIEVQTTETELERTLGSTPRTTLEVDEAIIQEGADINMVGGTKTLGGHTGGDFEGGGKGPALGAKHAADDSTADHYGSREETNAALEGKIALQNTRRLHGHY